MECSSTDAAKAMRLTADCLHQAGEHFGLTEAVAQMMYDSTRSFAEVIYVELEKRERRGEAVRAI